MSKPTREVFTLDLLEWSPWIERAIDTDLPEERKEEIRAFVGDAPNSIYSAVLANDFEALKARAKVHRHTFVPADDAELGAHRELGATTTSRINGCVFCASVHSRMYANYTKKRDVAQRFLDDGLDADLPPVARAVVDLSAKVTRDPESLTAADFAPLRELGFDDLTILDVVNYAAFFANANRLMLTLGEPKAPGRRSGSRY
jgi:uncharacterized peroxidase-related enzyme